MIDALLQSLVLDVLKTLSGKSQINEKTLGSISLAKSFQGVSPPEVIRELECLLKMLRKEIPLSGNVFTNALGCYFLHEFWQSFDQMDSHFFHKKLPEQRRILEGNFPHPSLFFEQLRSHLLFNSSQDITETIIQYASSLYRSPRILVQSPVECDLHLKNRIRQHFLQSSSQSFLAFQVNTQLIGGIRFFVDGTVQDLSWFSHIQALHSFSSHF